MKNSRTFASILAEIKHKGGNLIIGKYQRPASWGKEESYHFINDAYESKNDKDNNYGAAYLFERERKQTDAVESQQRFLSYISTVCAFKNFTYNKKINSNEDLKSIIQYIKEIITTTGGFPILKTIGQDNIDIEAIIDNDIQYIKNKENKKNTIIKNYAVFYSYINDIYKKEGVDGLISFFYDGINKGSLSIEYCETEEEVIKAFLRFNRGTTHVTPGQNIFTNIYGKIKSSEKYSEQEKEELLNRLQEIRADLNNDVFFSRFIYYKTGKKYVLSKISYEFKNIINKEQDLKSFINEIIRIYNFHKSIFKCDIKSDKYTQYELNKLNSVLKVFCDPNNCEDIIDVITDLIIYAKETIPIDCVIDLVYIIYYTHLRASIMGYSSHISDGFTIYPVVRQTLLEKNNSNTYQELLIEKISKIEVLFLKQYTNEEIIKKLKEINFYRTKFRDQILNIINNYQAEGELQNLFDSCNSVQREHIMPQNINSEFTHLIGNITVIMTKDNASNQDKTFSEKIDTFKNSNFLINKNIAEHEEWGENEILNETDRRAKIVAEVTNPLNFCKKCSKEIFNNTENIVKTEAVYT